ncbi:MAG: helix-turn-helix domain-containing protein [Myxococcales bacterium]|nr:helix-turn-helix domain-containing protein [Myxococcales bacterium]
MTPATLPRLLPLDEVARLTNVSRSWWYQAVRRGEIDAVRIGRRVLVAETVLSRWVESRSTAGAQPETGGAR